MLGTEFYLLMLQQILSRKMPFRCTMCIKGKHGTGSPGKSTDVIENVRSESITFGYDKTVKRIITHGLWTQFTKYRYSFKSTWTWIFICKSTTEPTREPTREIARWICELGLPAFGKFPSTELCFYGLHALTEERMKFLQNGSSLLWQKLPARKQSLLRTFSN